MTGVHLCVDVGGERYAMPVEHVLEVARVQTLTAVPGARPPLLGACNLRGEVLPVVDLGGLFGVGSGGPLAQIVVTQVDDIRAGLAVDTVVGVEVLPDPDTPTDMLHLSGAVLVDDELVGMLDIPSALRGLAAPGAA